MKAFKLSLALLLVLNLGACVVDDAEYDEALRQRDEYRAQLRELYQNNDTLNRQIAGVYAECEALSDKLALIAAARMQLEYTADLLSAPSRQRPRGTGRSDF